MSTLAEIPGIGASSLELLDAAGVTEVEDLATRDPEELTKELKRAIEILSINNRAPGGATVRKWIAAALNMIAETGPDSPVPEATGSPADMIEPAVTAPPVNYEGTPEVVELLGRAPCAIPLPGRYMMEQHLKVGDIPAGLLLNRYSGDLDVRVSNSDSPRMDLPNRRPSGPPSVSQQGQRRHFEAASAQPMLPSENGGKRLPKSKSGHEGDRVALLRAPRESTNQGKNPESRRYVRGVLHTHPWSLRIGAVLSLLLLVNLPIAVVTAFLLLASREYPGNFSWVPHWIIAFPIALPIVALGYWVWGYSGKCRICNQKLFVHKTAFKHIKAHSFPGLGFVVPLCLHLLAFNWFRCSSCGTPVRLKK